MRVREVLVEYSKKVSFPWSVAKIKKADFNPTKFLTSFGEELGRCDDFDDPESKAILEVVDELNLIP